MHLTKDLEHVFNVCGILWYIHLYTAISIKVVLNEFISDSQQPFALVFDFSARITDKIRECVPSICAFVQRNVASTQD
jgi:hypothetical protein